MSRFSNHLSPGTVIGVVALTIALTGSAIALPGKNSVDSGDIKNNTIKSKDIKNGKGVKSPDVKNDNLKGKDVKDDSLTGSDVDESSLGEVPSAAAATTAGTATNAEQLGGEGPGSYVKKTELLWALVDLDVGGATLAQNNGATTAVRTDVGEYTITFNRDISQCVIHGTPADVTGADPPRTYIVAVDHEGANAVEVWTSSTAAQANIDPSSTDGASLSVFC